MVPGSPFRWTEPASWPGPVYVWLAVLMGALAKQLYDCQRRKKSAAWPTVTGRIEAAEIPPPQKVLGLTLAPAGRGPCPVELRYSYSVQGQNYLGKMKRGLPNPAAAQEFIRGLQGMPVTVHYDSERNSASVLLDSSLEALMQARPPGPPAKDPIPRWLKPLLWPFVALSAFGLALSMWVHFGALMGRQVAPSEYFWMLHVGIFVVWLPAVLVAQKRTGYTSNKMPWKLAFEGSPKWMSYMVNVFFVYALVNFAIFMFHVPTDKQHGPEAPPEVWRGFSGHWMLFYSAALAMLYSAAKIDSSGARCVNGHPLPSSAAVCALCGQPASPFR